MLALIAAALLGADAPPAPANTSQDYLQAKAQAGRSPDDQVKLAYWCEAHGLSAERLRHLAQAVLADPNHAAARGLLGLVSRADRWVRPEAVAEQTRSDPAIAATLAEYDAKRSAAPYTADGQWALGLWAEEHDLSGQARAHWTAVVRLDPRRDAAWKKLGYARRDGRWATDAEVAAAKADAEAQKLADRKWRPLLEKWKAQLARPAHRAEAEANLRTVVDPCAVPTVARLFGASEADGSSLVQLLGQVDASAASQLLAHVALLHPQAAARRSAIETLRRRDPREYANLFIPLLHKPISYEIKPVNGPGSPGVLFVAGDRSNVKRLYEPRSLIQPNDRITTDRFGQPVVERVLGSAASGRVNEQGEVTHGQVKGWRTTYTDSFSQSSLGLGTLSGQQGIGTNPTLVADWSRMLQGASQGNPGGVAAAFRDLAAAGQNNLATQSRPTASTSAEGWAALIGQGWAVGGDGAVRTTEQFSLAQVMAEQQRSALMSQRQLENDVAQVEAQNRAIAATNDQAIGILNAATGVGLPADPAAWQAWWVNLLGYAQVAGQTEQNPTFVEVIPSGYQPEVLPTNIIRQTVAAEVVDCFGAGTLVRTQLGPRPIEELKVGDLVLTQATATGALGYRPITVTHHNPPVATSRIRLSDDTIVSNRFHRFWVARRGWVMARDLAPGDQLRTLGGIRAVESVEAGPVQPVFNLDVADDADFFAGASAALVHDNTLPDPRLVPFDLPTDPKAVAAK